MRSLLLSVALSILCSGTASCQVPAPTPQVSSPAATPAPLVTLDIADLNPAFKLSADEMEKAIQKGQSFAQRGKSSDDLDKDNTLMPVGVKGKRGVSHESRIVFETINGLTVSYDAFQATNRYEPLPKVSAEGHYENYAEFSVQLKSVPAVSKGIFGRNRAADQDDVVVEKFVLTDDKGDVFQPCNIVPGLVQSGNMDFSGARHIYHNDIAQVDIQSQSNVTEQGGNTATLNTTTTGTVSQPWVEVQPWSESHPFYSSFYAVQFPLFDKDGQPFIKSDVKTLTLHLITPNGEKAVTYELKPPKF